MSHSSSLYTNKSSLTGLPLTSGTLELDQFHELMGLAICSMADLKDVSFGSEHCILFPNDSGARRNDASRLRWLCQLLARPSTETLVLTCQAPCSNVAYGNALHFPTPVCPSTSKRERRWPSRSPFRRAPLVAGTRPPLRLCSMYRFEGAAFYSPNCRVRARLRAPR